MLIFLATAAEEFDSVGAFEAVAVHTLTCYMEDEAKDVQVEKLSDEDEELDRASFSAHARRTWKFVIDYIIRHFLTDEVLLEAKESVERAVNRLGE